MPPASDSCSSQYVHSDTKGTAQSFVHTQCFLKKQSLIRTPQKALHSVSVLIHSEHSIIRKLTYLRNNSRCVHPLFQTQIFHIEGKYVFGSLQSNFSSFKLFHTVRFIKYAFKYLVPTFLPDSVVSNTHQFLFLVRNVQAEQSMLYVPATLFCAYMSPIKHCNSNKHCLQ